MVKDLIKLANHLDKIGLSKRSDVIDNIILKISEKQEWSKNEEIDDVKYNWVPDEDGHKVQKDPAYKKDISNLDFDNLGVPGLPTKGEGWVDGVPTESDEERNEAGRGFGSKILYQETANDYSITEYAYDALGDYVKISYNFQKTIK